MILTAPFDGFGREAVQKKWGIMERCARLAEFVPSLQHDPNQQDGMAMMIAQVRYGL